MALALVAGAAACGADGASDALDDSTEVVEDGSTAVADDEVANDESANDEVANDEPANDAEGVDDQPDTEADSSGSGEPRFDPLPIPADIDQVEEVFRSLLGPTDDFVAQARRVAPDFRQLPTPEGAEIVRVSISSLDMPGNPEIETQSSVSVRMTSTVPAEEVEAWLRETIFAENPDWETARSSPGAPPDARILSFDLPDVEQPGGEQNLTPDLKITVNESDVGSLINISIVRPAPSESADSPYSGWQDQFPLPDGTARRYGSIAVDGQAGLLRVSASHEYSGGGLAEYRDDYLALLAAEGFTVAEEKPYREGTEMMLDGHPRFDTLRLRACCTENRYITEITNLGFDATIEL